MASKHAQDLRRRIDAAAENLSRQLQGMDAHMERADAPGEWTTREVLSHLLFEPGFDPAATLATLFAAHWNDHAGQLEKIRQAVGLGSDAAAKPGGMGA